MNIGEKVGKALRACHEHVYGGSNPSEVFAGGNAGSALLGAYLVEASKNIENGLIELSKNKQGETNVHINALSGGNPHNADTPTSAAKGNTRNSKSPNRGYVRRKAPR